MPTGGRVVVVNAVLRPGQKLALTLDAVQKAFVCGKEDMRLALWPAEGSTADEHAAVSERIYAAFSWALPPPWDEELTRSVNVVVAADALADPDIRASAYVGSRVEGVALEWMRRGPLLEWGTPGEDVRLLDAAIEHFLSANLPEVSLKEGALFRGLECSLCAEPLLRSGALGVHEKDDWALCCHACARRCLDCPREGELRFHTKREAPLDARWCRLQTAASAGTGSDDGEDLFLCFRASPQTWEEEALAAKADVPWRAGACANCDFWSTHAVHSAFLHIAGVNHEWGPESAAEDPDKQMSVTTQCATAVLRAEAAARRGRPLFLHIIAVPAHQRRPPWTVDLSSPAAREATLPSAWRQDWFRACKIDSGVGAYGEYWGDALSEVLLLRERLPRAVTAPLDSFDPALRRRLRERLPFACAACSDELEAACREEAVRLALAAGLGAPRSSAIRDRPAENCKC